MAKNKLQNIKAVQQMLDGTHKFQTKKVVGFSNASSVANKNKKRNIGEVWEEVDPLTNISYMYEQRDGYRVKKSKNTNTLQAVRDELNTFTNCRHETCACKQPNHLDVKMRSIHGMCFGCVIEMEHDLKKQGKYQEYEQAKIRENALAWLRSAERDVELLKEVYTQASTFVSNTEGQTENWSAKMTPEEFESTIQQQFNQFKEKFLENLNSEKNNETI
jgi:hypothetical protein